ncbi:MAG: cyclophilin-like fold protein [Bacteroidaceae bacterium]
MRIKFISHAWVTITLALSSITLTTCSKEEVAPVEAFGENMEDNNENFMTKNQINIVIGNTSFSAILEENATAKEWSYLLPLTLEMHELNGNEKNSNHTNYDHGFDNGNKCRRTGGAKQNGRERASAIGRTMGQNIP